MSFKPNRGLRQGDPLSSYLFILGQEILLRLLDQELRQKRICGIKTSKRGPVITHVIYADDIILFLKATKRDATNISRILDKYCLWLGQLVNKSKSSIFFSKHTQRHILRDIKNILHIRTIKKDATYLGALLLLTRAPFKDFAYLQTKLEARLAVWRSKCLSWAGRATLINSVAQTIPNYTMYTFSIPNKICNNLDSTTRRFWWKPKSQDSRFMAWRS